MSGKASRDYKGQVYLNFCVGANESGISEQKNKEMLDNLVCGAAMNEFDGSRLAALHKIAGHRRDDVVRVVLGADLLDHVLMPRMEGIVFGDDTDDFFSVDHFVLTDRIQTTPAGFSIRKRPGDPGHLFHMM